MAVDADSLSSHVEDKWESDIIGSLSEYIRIPALSPAFDPDWEANGHIEAAVEHIASWCAAQDIEGLVVEINRLPGRTPLIYMEVPGQIDENVLLYQHLDKQPEFVGWHEGLGPWEPVRRGDKLYGRGGADDGYGAYASLTAIKGLQLQGIPHANLKLIVEASEESGSPDLPAHLESLADRIGTPSLVVCLDSGAGDWDHLWLTTSLRG
nr:M20/M25/M40 family metallo-hydrolase [Candidatus Poseidoniaceae archaeon]